MASPTWRAGRANRGTDMRRRGRFSSIVAVLALLSGAVLTVEATSAAASGRDPSLRLEPAGRPARGSDKGGNPGSANAQMVRQRPFENQAAFDDEKDAVTADALAHATPGPADEGNSTAGPLAPAAFPSWN